MTIRFLIVSIFLFLNTVNLDSQSLHFTGTWKKIGTTYSFNFNLSLQHFENNQVKGHFDWTVIRYDEGSKLSEAHYKNKLGLQAREYVKGSFNPDSREYYLKGFRKDDPHNIIGLDTYRLKIDRAGNIYGDTHANNSWKGRIKGRKLIREVM